MLRYNDVVIILAMVAVGTVACGSSRVAPARADPTRAAVPADPIVPVRSTVVSLSEVDWQPLNPARGDASPLAGTLWGDRNGSGPTGFLFRPVNGFESPPHIHNVSYRGVVIRGLVHNDDPNAEEIWMPPGSFWTQPKGGVHITAARGDDILAYIEIDEGPYLVRPVGEAFESDETPVNVDASDIVWVDAADAMRNESTPTPASSTRAALSFLWGSPTGPQPSGVLIRLPPESTATMRSRGSTFRGVLIAGRAQHRWGEETPGIVELGSYFSSEGGSEHEVSCAAGGSCLIYARTECGLEVRLPE
ncbi:MAG: DUF4437 domain-containing protein [Myxococcota bacterium]